MFYYTFSVINTVCSMHCAAVWLQSSNSNNKIFHNPTEHFLCNPSDFFSDYVLFRPWIVFKNSVFEVPLQKIVRRVEILGIGWPGVIGFTWHESVPWEVMPAIFKWWWFEMRWCLISRTEIYFTILKNCLEVK